MEEEQQPQAEARVPKEPKQLKLSAGKQSCSIFRIPKSLFKLNPNAYKPHIVSIGPYHHGNGNLTMMQEHKRRFLDLLFDTKHSRISLSGLVSLIAPMEIEIRECYSENIDKFNKRQLLEMMVLDGSFIIALFLIVNGQLTYDSLEYDPIFKMAWVLPSLTRDLLKLENQIPFRVLEKLFDFYKSSKNEAVPRLTELAFGLFNYQIESPKEIQQKEYSEVKHLLELFRSSFIPANNNSQSDKNQEIETNCCGRSLRVTISPESNTDSSYLQMIPSAGKLRLRGVKLSPKENANSFLDIEFNKGTLKIPTVVLDDFISSIFLNSIAFELCHSDCSSHFTSYVIFMGCLFDTATDVGLLCDRGIVDNSFGTDGEVARFFHKAGKEVVFHMDDSYISGLFKQINKYCRNSCHVWWAEFLHTHFDSPWAFMSSFAALVLLILTCIQAYFAVYAYIRPPK